MKPLYKPKGRAAEYGDFAINIYTGCPHRCFYCYAPNVLRRDRENFHSYVVPRPGIVDAVKRQLEKEKITGQLIHLCFTCDPYPRGYDSSATREIIKLIKASGNHVQILTKNADTIRRDFDLFDENDMIGVSVSCQNINFPKWEPNASLPTDRIFMLSDVKGCCKSKTWVSFEPVLDPSIVYWFIRYGQYIDKFKIGKLNYHPSDINWAAFGREAERICIERGLDYIIKDDLRREMEKDGEQDAGK